MTEFSVSIKLRETEAANLSQRKLARNSLFILLLGPSAVGKSTIIQKLIGDGVIHFNYVKPFMTRQNRPDESDKISVSENQFADHERRKEFVAVNDLYGVRYGTPLSGILGPLSQNKVPVLDYPLQRVQTLIRPDYNLLGVYIYPSSIESWMDRVKQTGRNTNNRLATGLTELEALAECGMSHPFIDLSIVNSDGDPTTSANSIIDAIKKLTS